MVSTIKSESKLRHFADIPKTGKTHKLTAGKIASSSAKETKRTFASGAHIAAKSDVTYSRVPLRKMGVTEKRKEILPSGKDSFSHVTSKARALNVNGADKHSSEVFNMVRPSDYPARKETTIHGHTRGNETPKHERHSSPTLVGNRQYQASDLWNFKGSKFDPKSRKVRVESFASHSAEKSFLKDDEVGSSQNFDSSSYEKEGLSADGEMSEDDVVSGDVDSSGDGDLSRYGYLSGHRLPIRAVKDSSEGYNDVSGEREGQNDSEDESGYDLSGEDKRFSGNDDDFSGDSVDTMTYNPMRHKLSAGEREEYETTRKTVDVNFSGSGDGESDEGSGDNSEIQKKTSLNKNNKKRKMDLVEALDDLDEGTTRKSGRVVPLPQRGSATMKSKVKANSSHPKSQEDVKEIKGSKIIEHLNDLGSGDTDSETSSKEVAKLHREANNSREEGEKKVNKKLRKLKHRDNTREKSDLMEEVDALGSDDGGNEKISQSVEHLLHETINSTKKREKVDNKQIGPKQKDSLRRKSELVNDPDDLGSDDDDEKKARKATHLLQETRTSKTAKTWQKAGKENMKLKEGSISKKSTIAEVPNSLTSADRDDESNRKVLIAHKQSNISEAESQSSKTFLRKQVIVKSQKEGSKREEIEYAEDPDDLGSDNDEEEKSSKALSRLSYQISTPKVTKNRKNHQALKKGGIVKEKMDFVEDVDELGSDDSDPLSANQDTLRKMATRLPPQTQVSRTGRKQQKFNRSSSTKEKIDFVQDLHDLGLNDDKSGTSKLRKHDALTSTKVTKLSKTSNRSISGEKKKSVKYLKSSDGQTASNLNLAEDLDDLGADDDYFDETKPEQPALSLPVRTNDRTGQIPSVQRTSSDGHMGSPPRNKGTKQASTTFGLSVGDSNKSHIVSRQSGHSVSGGLTHHGISRKGGHVLGPIQVKGKSDLTKASRVKDEKQKQQTVHIEEKEPGQAASLKQVKKPSPSIKTENILNSKSREAIVQNKRAKGNSTNPHQAKLRITEPTKTKKVPTSSETLKTITKNRSDGVPLNNQATLTRTKTVMAPIASNDKLKVSVKAHTANKSHLNVTSKERAEKSTLRDENKSAIKANKPKESVALKRKDTAKQRKTPSIDSHIDRSTFASRKGTKKSSKVSSKFEVIDDLMKFAHRKKSVKKKVEHFVASGKKTSSSKTIPQQQGRDKVLTNDSGTIRGKQPMTLHATKTKTIYPLHRKKVIISHLQSSGKLAAKKSQTTASPPVSRHFTLTTQFHASSKKNGSLSSTPASKAHFRTQETNPPERNQNIYNRAFLSLKQRSNEQVLDNKSELLAHFRNVNGSDGVEFSVKTSGSHHKEKHSKHDLSFDLDDIGDADFDIMMSNDIPHKHLPEKKKSKESREKHTKSSDEKQHVPSPDSLKKKRKNSDGDLRNKGEDKSEESEPDSKTHHSHHKHKEITNDVITRKRHHHHHHLPLKESDNNVDSNDRDETHFSKKVGKGRSHDEKKSHRHDRHDTSNSADEKDSERVHHHHKKHRHRATAARKDDFSDDKDNDEDSKVKSDHKKRRKERDKAENNDKSEKGEKVEHHNHHSHKAHSKKYDNNDWEGNIIPGKVKLVYEKDSDRKRHHKHKTRNEEEINPHKRKHVFQAKKSREDSENSKDDSHSHHEHHTQSDDYNQRKKHAKDHEAVKKDDSEEKVKIENNNEEEHAEKKKEVNYEAIKTGRHRFVQHEDDNEGETHQGDDYDSDREDGSSWTSKKDDKDDENEKSNDNDNNSDERGKSDDSEDANENDADDDDKEERPSKETKKNMVVLGEDSDSDDDDDDDDEPKHSRKVHERRHGHKHVTEHNIDEQENEKDYLEHKYHEENHKTALHHRRRHKYHRHLKAKHRHHESDYENKEDDYNDENDDDDEAESRKSFIKDKKEKEDEIQRDHYDKKRNRKKQHYHNTAESSEESKDYRARKFHRSHHRHHHLRPVVDIDRIKERPADGYEPDDEKDHVGNDEEHDEEEKFPRRHRTHEHGPAEEENNNENFQRKKEGSDDHFAPPEHDRGRWKFKAEEYHREFKGASHQLDNQDFSDNRFMGEENHKGYHHNRRPEYNERPKFKPRKRKKERWKSRYYYNDNEDQDYEDSGGLFDSSSWTPNENYDDDDFYGGEGNHERRHYRKKHRKYKNRKDRQSYEYWAYGNQYPYYGYKYHRVRSRYQNNQRQPNPYYDWRNRYRNYNGWKSTPSHWYSNKQPWDGTRSWRHHPKWTQRFDDYKPTGYQWHKFYDNNDDYRYRNQPRPTAYPREASTFLPPTSSIWQKQLDDSHRGFIGDKGLSQNREPGNNYQDWSRYKPSASLNQASSNYRPQQRPLAGFQPRPNPDAVKPADQTQPLGILSNYVPPASQQGPGRIDNQTKFRPTVRRQYAGTPPLKILSPTNDFIKIKNLMDTLNTSSSASNIQPPTNVTSNVQNNANIKNGLPKTNVSSSGQDEDQKRLNGFFNEENAGKKSDILRPKNNSQGQAATNVLGK